MTGRVKKGRCTENWMTDSRADELCQVAIRIMACEPFESQRIEQQLNLSKLGNDHRQYDAKDVPLLMGEVHGKNGIQTVRVKMLCACQSPRICTFPQDSQSVYTVNIVRKPRKP